LHQSKLIAAAAGSPAGGLDAQDAMSKAVCCTPFAPAYLPSASFQRPVGREPAHEQVIF